MCHNFMDANRRHEILKQLPEFEHPCMSSLSPSSHRSGRGVHPHIQWNVLQERNMEPEKHTALQQPLSKPSLCPRSSSPNIAPCKYYLEKCPKERVVRALHSWHAQKDLQESEKTTEEWFSTLWLCTSSHFIDGNTEA